MDEPLPPNVDFDNTEFWGIPQHSKSPVWLHFRCKKDEGGLILLQFAYCIYCRVAFSYGEKYHSVSNLKKHLQYKHPHAWKKFTDDSGEPEAKRSKVSIQPTIQATYIRHDNNNHDERERRRIQTELLNSKLVRFVCSALLAFNVLENRELRESYKIMDPGFQFPSRKYFTSVLLHKEYEILRGALVNTIRQHAGWFSITLDFWTSRATTSFVTLTLHWIDPGFTLISKNVTSQAVYENHTGSNIKQLVLEILRSWEIPLSRVAAIVSDTASNMIKAADNLDKPWLGCFAHRLHLCVTEGLKEFSDLLTKCRTLITHFKKSTKATIALEETCKEIGVEWKKLLQDVPTRWTSTYTMLKRLLDCQLPLQKLHRSGALLIPSLSCVEWDMVHKIAASLFPLHQIMVKTQAQKYITISMVVPLLQDLRYVQLIAEEEDEPQIKQFMNTIVLGLNNRFQISMETSKIELVAAALDPRFKNLVFLKDPGLKKQVWDTIEADAKMLEPKDDEVILQGRSFTVEEELLMIKDPLHEDLDVLFQSEAWTKRDDAASPAKLELERWKLETPIHYTKNPLEWWKANQCKFPILAQLAARYLSIPATNAPSERAFSILGHTIQQRRSQLSPNNVHKVFFIHENM